MFAEQGNIKSIEGHAFNALQFETGFQAGFFEGCFAEMK
jgi:hypothetical protein